LVSCADLRDSAKEPEIAAVTHRTKERENQLSRTLPTRFGNLARNFDIALNPRMDQLHFFFDADH
jgi:hypothetical protein